jgi:WD40 repeat protein
MKKAVYFIVIIALVLSGCGFSTEIPVSTNTVVPSETSTNAPPTATARPTGTPVLPTATFVPLRVIPVAASPLTLTEFNAGTEMKRLNVIGTGTAHDIKFAPDGKRLAIATGRGIFLYDGTTYQQDGFIDVNASVSAIAFSPDGNVLAVASDGKASLWNIQSGREMISLDGGMNSIFKLAYGLGGYVAAMGGDCSGCGSPQQAMILWDAKTGRQIYSQHDIWFSTSALTFTTDGKQLFFGGGGVSVIETRTGKKIAGYTSETPRISTAIDAPYDFIFNKDSTHLFVTSFEESSEIFDITTKTQKPFSLCDTYLTSNGTYGACSKDNNISIFDLINGEELQRVSIDVEASSLGDMFVLSPDGNFLVYYGKTGVNIIDIKTKEKIMGISLTDFGITEAGIIEIDGIKKYAIATLTYSGQVEIYDIQTNEILRTLKLDCCEIKGFDFAPDQRTFATIETKNLKFWDLQSGKVIYETDLEDDFSGPITFSPDGRSIFLTHNPERYILELDLQSGKTINRGNNSYAYDYADPFAVGNYHFNGLGNLIVFRYERNNEGQQPSFQDVKTKAKITLPIDIEIDPDFIEAFALSLDGQYLSYGSPTDIFVWNIKTLKLQSKLTGHETRSGDGWYGKIRALEFNPQSNLLVSVGWDDTVRLWNVKFGNELRRLNVCCSADFTPDGRYLITYGDGVALVWGIPE